MVLGPQALWPRAVAPTAPPLEPVLLLGKYASEMRVPCWNEYTTQLWA